MKVVPCRAYAKWLIVKPVTVKKPSVIQLPEFDKPKLTGVVKVVEGPEESIGKLFIVDQRMVREQDLAGETVYMVEESCLFAEIVDSTGLEIVDFADMSIPEIMKSGNNFHGSPEFEMIKIGHSK